MISFKIVLKIILCPATKLVLTLLKLVLIKCVLLKVCPETNSLHSLSCLPSNIDQLVHLQLYHLLHVEDSVQRRTLAPLGHYGDLG